MRISHDSFFRFVAEINYLAASAAAAAALVDLM